MEKKLLKFKTGLAILLLILVPTVFASHTSTHSKLKRLLNKITHTKTELTSTKHKKHSIQKQLKHTEVSLSYIRRRNHKIRQEILAEKRALAKLNIKKDQLEETLERQKINLSKLFKASYMLGHEQYLKLLLNQEDMARSKRMLVYYKSLIKMRKDAAYTLGGTLRKIEKNRREIIARKNALLTLNNKQLKQRKILEATKKKRRKVLASVSAELRTKSAKLKKLMRDKAALEKVIRRINAQKSLANAKLTGKFAKLQHKLSWPVKGRVISDFGKPIVHSNFKTNGVLLAAKPGTPVHAIAAGTVVFADWLTGYGLLIIVDHGSGYMSLYGHNQNIYHSVGDQITARTTIASVGSSGGFSKSALYFAVRYKGRVLNPRIWIHR